MITITQLLFAIFSLSIRISSLTATTPLTYKSLRPIVGAETMRMQLLEIEFDEELEFVDGMVCGCLNTGVCSDRTLDPLDESSYTGPNAITEMTPGVEYLRSTTSPNTTGALFKFQIPTPSGNSCPRVVITFNNIIGLSVLYISTKTISDPLSNFNFYKPPWTSHQKWVFCPQHPLYGFGTWYITVLDHNPTVGTVCSIKVELLDDLPQCSDLPPYTSPVQPQESDTWQLITPGITQLILLNYSDADPYQFQYFRYYVPNNALCSNFTVSARRVDRAAGDSDFYVSTTNPTPRLGGDYEWSEAIDDDGAMTVYGVCTDTPPLVFYVGIYSLFSNELQVQLTGSHDLSQAFLTPFSDYPPLQYQQSTTNMAQFNCLNNTEPTILYMEYLPYQACYIDQYRCGWPFGPVLGTDSPNPLYPPNLSFPDFFENLGNLPWGDVAKFVDIYGTTTNSNKVAFFVATTYSDHETRNGVLVFLQNFTSCTLKFKNRVIGEASGEVIPPYDLPLEQKQIACESQKVTPWVNELSAQIDAMTTAGEQLTLNLLELQITFHLFNDSWIGCKTLMDDLLDQTTLTNVYPESNSCPNSVGSEVGDNDPCCAYSPQLTSCCNYTQTFTSSVPTTVVNSGVDRCTETACVVAALESYAVQESRVSNVQSGCVPTFANDISSVIIFDKLAFSQQCRWNVLWQDLGGPSCSTNCSGTVCDTNIGRCAFDIGTILSCWADYLINDDNELGQILWTGIYGYSEVIEYDNLLSNLTARYSMTGCLGIGAVSFYTHYRYTLDISGCTDECALENLAPNCLDTELQFCDLPATCMVQTSTCYRSWKTFNALDQSQCATWECNWMNCSGLSLEDCQTNCSTRTDQFCASLPCYQSTDDTTDPQCTLYLSVPDQATCEAGVCSWDETLNATQCADNGICTDSTGAQICNSSDSSCTESYCLGLASCSTTQAISSLGTGLTGVCVSLFLSDFYGVPYCNTVGILDIGCTVPGLDQTSCVNPNLWVPLGTTQADCESVSSCYTGTIFLLNYTQPQCMYCGRNWSQIATWQVVCAHPIKSIPLTCQPTWTPAKMLPRQWIMPQFYQPRSERPSLNFTAFQNDLTNAIFVQGSSAYSTAALCKYGSSVSAVRVACSCGDESCFINEATSQLVGMESGCIFINTSFIAFNNTFQLYSYPDTIGQEVGCLKYSLGTSNVNLHISAQGKLNSAVFFVQPPNAYSAVLNSNLAVIGQLFSDGVEVTLTQPVTNPFGLCTQTFNGSIEVDESFPILGFAYIKNGSTDQTIRALPNEVYINEDGLVCANVTESGVYFAVYLQEDWPSVPSYGSDSLEAQAIAAAVIYFILTILSFIVLIMVWIPLNKWDLLTLVKRVMLAGFCAYTILRGIFFALPPYSYRTNAVAGVLLFEIPTLLYYICYITLLYVWGTFLGKTWEAQHKKDPSKLIFAIYLVIIFLVLLIFAVFLIAFYTLPDTSLACVTGAVGVTISEQKKAVNLVYTIYVCSLSIILGFLVVVLAIMVIWPLYQNQKHNPNQSAKKKLIVIIKMAAIISIFTSTAFIAKSVIVLVSNTTNQLTILMVFCALEMVSSVVFLWYFMPPQYCGGKKKKGQKPNRGPSGPTKSKSSSTKPSVD